MSEALEHEMVCSYLKVNYPDVVFLSDASGLSLPKGQATKWSRLKSEKGLPDLIILEPRGTWHGLCLEMKRTGKKLVKKNGELMKDEHLKEQYELLNKLLGKRYYCNFAIGFEHARKIIEEYMDFGPASP